MRRARRAVAVSLSARAALGLFAAATIGAVLLAAAWTLRHSARRRALRYAPFAAAFGGLLSITVGR